MHRSLFCRKNAPPTTNDDENINRTLIMERYNVVICFVQFSNLIDVLVSVNYQLSIRISYKHQSPNYFNEVFPRVISVGSFLMGRMF